MGRQSLWPARRWHDDPLQNSGVCQNLTQNSHGGLPGQTDRGGHDARVRAEHDKCWGDNTFYPAKPKQQRKTPVPVKPLSNNVVTHT